MRGLWNSISRFPRTILRVLVLFAIFRLGFGVFAIAILSDDSLAYGLRATAILAAAAVLCVAVALVIREMRAPNDQHPTIND